MRSSFYLSEGAFRSPRTPRKYGLRWDLICVLAACGAFWAGALFLVMHLI
jgi:hypothetical protein